VRSTLDPTLDVVFKLLFGAPESHDVLVALLTAVLRPTAPITGVQVLNPELPREHVIDRGIVLDLLVALGDGRRVNLEMQAHKREAFLQRGVFYWARAYSAQLERGQGYQALRPVVSVLFLDYVELAGDRWHSTYRVLETEAHTDLCDALEMHVIELPKRTWRARAQARAQAQAQGGERPGAGPVGAGARNDDAELLAWVRFLGATSDEEVKEACMSSQEVARANELLTELSASPRAQELARERKIALEFYRMELQAASDRATREGLAAGIAKGIAEGMAKGMAKGMAEGKAEGQGRVLLRLLEQRFGPVPGEVCDRVFHASPDDVDRWVDRVLSAPTLDALFAPVPE
jgi:hypothetical protein